MELDEKTTDDFSRFFKFRREFSIFQNILMNLITIVSNFTWTISRREDVFRSRYLLPHILQSIQGDEFHLSILWQKKNVHNREKVNLLFLYPNVYICRDK